MLKKHFDLNKDGKVDHQDAVLAAKGIGITVTSAAVAVGVTSAIAAAAGSALVAGKAASIGTTLAVGAGMATGTVVGLFAGTSTAGFIAITQIGNAFFVESAIITSVSLDVVTTWAAATTGVAAAAEIAGGFIAGMPIVKTAAIASLKASGEIIVIGGKAFSVGAAISTGLVVTIIVAGIAYYLLTELGKDAVSQSQIEDRGSC
jgi:hypothetical protein